MAEQLQACCEAIVNHLNQLLSPGFVIELYCGLVLPIAACFRSNRKTSYIKKGNHGRLSMLEVYVLIISYGAALPLSSLQPLTNLSLQGFPPK